MFIVSWNFPQDFHNPVKNYLKKKETFTSRQRRAISLRTFSTSWKATEQIPEGSSIGGLWWGWLCAVAGGWGVGSRGWMETETHSHIVHCSADAILKFWIEPVVLKLHFLTDLTNGLQAWVTVRECRKQKEKKKELTFAEHFLWNRHVFMQFVWVIDQHNSDPNEAAT